MGQLRYWYPIAYFKSNVVCVNGPPGGRDQNGFTTARTTMTTIKTAGISLAMR